MPATRSYDEVVRNIRGLCEDEHDDIAKMATIACELFQGFEEFNWVGFYRVVDDANLKIGPYQGSHGCIDIPFSNGLCGACARTQETQIVDDVNAIADHIACSASTRSEIVVPVMKDGRLIAVLDIDSDHPAEFTQQDAKQLEAILTASF